MNIKRFFADQLSLLALCLLFCSCTMHETLPPEVTSPTAQAVFNRARNGDAEALYEMHDYYERGLYGFSSSSLRADYCLKAAARRGYPDAIAEVAIEDFERAEAEGTYNDKAYSCLCRLANNGSSAVAREYIDRHLLELEKRRLARAEDARWQSEGKCPRCRGTGYTGYSLKLAEGVRIGPQTSRCISCNGSGVYCNF